MPNIKFSYLYRDSANYKYFNFITFSNPEGIQLSDLEQLIKSKLIDETYFYTYRWKVPNLFSTYFNPDIDPTWHEFESIEYSGLDADAPQNLSHFIKLITATKLPS